MLSLFGIIESVYTCSFLFIPWQPYPGNYKHLTSEEAMQ